MSFKFEELREKYQSFIYSGFETIRTEDKLKVVYDFEVPGLARFNPSLEFPLDHKLIINDALSPFAEKILFSIGMVELISYWKIACPPRVEVKAGKLTDDQINWWKSLYFNGLGEFFFKNGISPSKSDFMSIETSGKDFSEISSDFRTQGLNLIPVGGGKDSIVTLEHLSKVRDNNVCFGLNPTVASRDSMEIAGYSNEQRFIVSRTLDPEMLRLNKEGYLNGHTPFSALLAFVSYYVAYLIGAENIILSNEASANAASIPGTEINHQYSKTSEFEIAFQNYSEKYFSDKIYYFSLLRPFAELAIARSFCQYEQYFQAFRSCNLGSKKNIWCGECPKCLFIYVMISPFLQAEKVESIFGQNLWEKESLVKDWKELIGIMPQKPFECVGTVEEVQYATYLIVNKTLDNGAEISELPLLLSIAVESAKNGDLSELKFDENTNRLISEAKVNPLSLWHEDERVPENFKGLIMDILAE